MSQRIQPPFDVEAILAKQWATVLNNVGGVLASKGKSSAEYSAAMAVSLTFTTAVMVCYGFDGDRPLSEAQAYLEDLLKRYPPNAH